MFDLVKNRPDALVPVSKKGGAKGRVDIKPFIMKAFNNEDVLKAISPLLLNGSVHGHKVLDLAAVLDIVVKFDNKHGASIEDSGLNRMEKVSQVLVALRRPYSVSKQWKIVGVNEKRYVTPATIDAPANENQGASE